MDVHDDTCDEGFHFLGLQFRGEPIADQQHYLVRFGLGGASSPDSCDALASDSSFENITESPIADSCWVELPEAFQSGQWNHFEITANGPVITYMVNDIFVASLNDPRLTEGIFALLAGTNSADSARIKIDNIRIKQWKSNFNDPLSFYMRFFFASFLNI